MKRFFLILSVFLFCVGYVSAEWEFNDLYNAMFNDVFGFIPADQNTGLTSFPTLLIPMGGLYEAMGTAYTAVASDSGFLESNPAGSSVLDISELSFMHNTLFADTNLEGVLYTVRFNNLGIGIGGKFLYVPFTGIDMWGDRTAKGYYSETVATANISYNFFSSYYFYGLSAGINLKLAYRHIPEVIAANQSAFSIIGDFGLLTRFNFLKFYSSRDKNFSFGAVVKNLGSPAIDDPLPMIATAGIAYSPIRPVLISLDFNLPFTLDPEKPAEIWNLAGGINVTFTNFFSAQAGFKYRGNNPAISLGSMIDLEDIRININYTIDMTTRFTGINKFSVSAKLKLGDDGRSATAQYIDELFIIGLESYAKGNIEEALKYWREVLELDPTYLPAFENIEIAETTLNQQREMEEIQSVGE